MLNNGFSFRKKRKRHTKVDILDLKKHINLNCSLLKGSVFIMKISKNKDGNSNLVQILCIKIYITHTVHNELESHLKYTKCSQINAKMYIHLRHHSISYM